MSPLAKQLWAIIALALIIAGVGFVVYGTIAITVLLGPPWSYVILGVFLIVAGASVGESAT